MITIIPYEAKYQPDFFRLNIIWLDQYNLTESHDLEMLNHPEKNIIDNHGYIWLAKDEARIVGTAAIIKAEHGVYELAKMSVDEDYKGRGISKLLMETCIDKAKELGVGKLELFSNHQLATALKLYEKYGFEHVEVTNSPFATADVKMELVL